MSRLGPLALVTLLLGCSGGEETASPAFESDARHLAEVIATDPAPAILDDVDDAIDTDRPVLGADLLDELGLPAMRREVTRLEDTEVRTSEGRTFRARAVRLYRARVTAYEAYQAALMRGLVDDAELLDALDAVSENQRELVALARELAAIAPITPTDEADESASLGGLPPIVREAPPPDDETLGVEPEGREENPAHVEDALPEM